MEFEHCFRVLQHSTHNDERQQASKNLRRIQESSPGEFLSYAVPIALCSAPTSSDHASFFAATVVFEFVENNWAVLVDTDMKNRVLSMYLNFLCKEALQDPTRPLGRKLCVTLAVMTKTQMPKKTPKTASQGLNALPEVLHEVLKSLIEAANANPPCTMQCLLAIHVLLKELAAKRIGKVFDNASSAVAPYLEQWLAASSQQPQLRPLLVICLKIALRVYGHGHFDPQALRHLLTLAFSLAGEVSPQSPVAVRALEYTTKILLHAVESMAPRFTELGTEFFVSLDPNAQTMFRFLFLAVQACWNAAFAFRQQSNGDAAGDGELGFTDKLACRSMRLIQALVERETMDPFITSVLTLFASSEGCSQLIGLLVEKYLADEFGAPQQQQWIDDPENFVAELDVVVDEFSPASQAEQLFIALTGSSVCSASCSTAAWACVSSLLAINSEASVTAALHAIGLGYYTLSVNSDPSLYVAFLAQTLLPMIAGVSPASPLVLRRVVWVVGQWCESVPDAATRQQIHNAFAHLLLPATDTVVLLTTLRAVSCFLGDNAFTLTELEGQGFANNASYNAVLPVYVTQILECLRCIIPKLQAAPMIKEIVGLCLLLTEKKTLTRGGEVMIYVLQPTLGHFMNMSRKLQSESAASDDHATAGSDNIAGTSELATFGLILEAVSSAIKIATDAGTIWSLLPVVLECTNPQNTVTSWTEDYAWELLLSMIHYTAVGVVSDDVQQQIAAGFAWSVQNLERDFESLTTAVRCVTGFVVLLGPLVPLHQLEYLLQKVGSSLFTVDGSVFEAYSGLASVLLMQRPQFVAPAMIQPLLQYTHSLTDSNLQDDERVGSVAVLIAQLTLQQGVPLESFATAEVARMIRCPDELRLEQSLMEKWSLVLDVTPNKYASRSIVLGASSLAQRGFITSPSDLDMLRHAVESLENTAETKSHAGARSPTAGCNHHHHGKGEVEDDMVDMEEEERHPLELLMEWLGDGSVVKESPHGQRLAALYCIH